MKSKKSKLSLEDYIDFLSSHKQHTLNVNSLNQIRNIHGFKKQKKIKKELSDAVETINLMDPSRSTLKLSIFSSNAWLTEKEVTRDHDNLKLKECCVTSIKALNSSSFTDQQQFVPEETQAKWNRSALHSFFRRR